MTKLFTYAGDALVLHESLGDFAAGTDALQQISEWLAEQGLTGPLMGESYSVAPAGRETALCVIDRATGAYFGIRAFGQHLNAYVRRNRGSLYVDWAPGKGQVDFSGTSGQYGGRWAATRGQPAG